MFSKRAMQCAFGLCVIVQSSTYALKVGLTDAIQRVTTGFPADPSLSQDGKKAYIVYEINVSNTVTLAAEIFDNNNGRLKSVAHLEGDKNFSSIDEGHANPDFTRFSLVDDDGNNKIRIRIFGPHFNLKASRVFNDFAAGNPSNPSFSGAGGVFSEDGKLVALSYLTNATPNKQKSILHILKASDLSDVASIDFAGGSNGPTFLTLSNHSQTTYITLTSYAGDYIFSFDNNTAKPPSTLFVYRLKGSKLSLVDTAALPQAGSTQPTVFTSDGEALIGVGTSRAVLTGEKTIFANNSTHNSFLKNDGNELRIYLFDGKTLHLALSKNPNLTTNSPTFYPHGSIILVNEQAIDGEPGFFNLYKMCKCPHREDRLNLCFINGTLASPPFHLDTFSQNGEWLLVTGSDQNKKLLDINLYKISA